MIFLETENAYYNTQVYFRRNYFDNMPNNEGVWRERYAQWLSEQGCRIVTPPSTIPVVRNSLGVAPGYDMFGFERQEDAVMFALRWI